MGADRGREGLPGRSQQSVHAARVPVPDALRSATVTLETLRAAN